MKNKLELFTACRDTNLKDKAAALGYASMIMFRCKRSSNFHMRTLNFWLTPAIDHQQIMFLFDRTSTPIGFVIWAHLAPDTEERLLADPAFLLHPSEWNEGGRTWVIDLCLPCGGAMESIKKIKSTFRKTCIDKVFWVRRNNDYSVKKTGHYRL
ncbi:RTX toxin acyltransferase family protein [compost metagenome]|uniref:toxin-activating lysine-acyltransferase n=1 Tax=Pseudomonas laurylsulfatiphila TaxID=2011015 RepID=UPI000F9E9E0A|nr:cytolysin-activating lysine-acyltransferase [Pseudomonas reinekei]